MPSQNRCAAFCLLTILSFLMACANGQQKDIIFPETDLSTTALIPLPMNIEASGDGFALDEYTGIYTSQDQGFADAGKFLARKINARTPIRIKVNSEGEGGGVILIRKADRPELANDEAYHLRISRDTILLESKTAKGAFLGVQTIRQLISEAADQSLADYPIWVIPTGQIYDAPQYEYRSTMLDVSRHFFSVADVKKYIDHISYYKMNTLHLHLSDDQGWRIEIKAWPKLTEIGGSTEVGGKSGGFYTQEDYKDIVNYAAAHHITIVPEIDMPGHTNAASVSYPWLNGNGKTPELYEGTLVGFSTFDTRKDSVYAFIDDVVKEISALSPGPYFHIGGDESHVTEKDDYIYFVNRVEKIVQKHGKRLIGWDEVATADLDATSIAQVWASEENQKLAIGKGMKVILSPAKKAYLDMKYDTLSKHGLTWAGIIPVDTGYVWSPESYGPKESILGVEAPLWSETISNLAELEYLAFPRLMGYAELGWTIEGNRNWTDYEKRLAGQVPYLNRMKVQFYKSPRVDWDGAKDLTDITSK